MLYSSIYAMHSENDDNDKKYLPCKKIGEFSSQETTNQRISFNGNSLIFLEKVFHMKQTGYQLAQKVVGQTDSVIATYFFKKNIPLSFLEIDYHGKHVLFSRKKTLYIKDNESNTLDRIIFESKITALAIEPNAEYFAVGLENGSLAFYGFKKNTCKLELPKVHANAITSITFDQNSFMTCDIIGHNYHWKNIWSNKRHYTRYSTCLPAIACKIGSNFFALQHSANHLEYPKVSIINRITQQASTLYGTLLGITENDEVWLEQEHSKLFLCTPEGKIIKKYILPENNGIIENRNQEDPISFLIKKDKEENEVHKIELFAPVFN